MANSRTVAGNIQDEPEVFRSTTNKASALKNKQKEAHLWGYVEGAVDGQS